MPVIRQNPCCCGDCVGVCFPEIDGVLQNLQWTVDAPNCGDIDGTTGIFNPIDPQFQQSGACGRCSCYQNISDSVSVPGQLKTPVGDMCMFTPCSIPLCFALTSDPLEEPEPGVEACCGRLRLLVGTVSGITLGGAPAIDTGCDADHPSTPCADFTEWVELAPVSCVCDEVAGLTAVFDLSVLSLTCATTYPSGPCIGEPDCCQPFACSFVDATVTVEVL